MEIHIIEIGNLSKKWLEVFLPLTYFKMKNIKLILIIIVVFLTTQTFAQSSGVTYSKPYPQPTYTQPTYNFYKDTSRSYGTGTFMIYKTDFLENKFNKNKGQYGDSFGINVSSCSKTTYLGTMSKSVKFTSSKTKDSTSHNNNQNSISLFDLLADAMAKYGNEVFIQNLRWNMKNKKKISVVYDVIKYKVRDPFFIGDGKYY